MVRHRVRMGRRQTLSWRTIASSRRCSQWFDDRSQLRMIRDKLALDIGNDCVARCATLAFRLARWARASSGADLR